jgi:hypothetical protein
VKNSQTVCTTCRTQKAMLQRYLEDREVVKERESERERERHFFLLLKYCIG